jgi:outer membrane protein TolC
VGDRAPNLRAMAQEAYRSGARDILALLDSTRSELDLALLQLALTAAVVDAEIDVLVAQGNVEALSAE